MVFPSERITKRPKFLFLLNVSAQIGLANLICTIALA